MSQPNPLYNTYGAPRYAPPQQYMAPAQPGRGYMVAGARTMGQMPQGQQMMQPAMSMMPPRGVQPMPRAPLPANGQPMPLPNQAYGNAGDQLMMVLNGGNPAPQYQMRDYAAMQGGRTSPNREFSMDHSEFPALSGQPPQAQGNLPPAPSSMGPRKDAPPMMVQYGAQQPPQQQQMPQQGPAPTPQQQQQQYARSYSQQSAPQQPNGGTGTNGRTGAGIGGGGGAGAVGATGGVGAREDPQTQYGLLGLLGLIRMTDRDLSTLALGTDLTTLGLNLNSAEPLYATFASPWSENPLNKDPHHLPESYTIPNLTPPSQMLHLLQDQTILYAFYTTPHDVLQLHCARELFKRGWRYHKELQRWIFKIVGPEPRVTTQAYDRGPYFIYDPATWEKVRNDNFLVVFEKVADKESDMR